MSQLYEKLIEYSHSDFYPFHMPGHKRNKDSACCKEDPVSEIIPIDITEIDGFDNLHDAKGIIKEAEKEAAALYKSENTHFLINGSTCGVLASISAVSSLGDTLIIARNCHRSVYHGALINRLNLAYIYPKTDSEFDISGGLSVSEVMEVVSGVKKRGGTPAGVVITSPTYEGVVLKVEDIAKALHAEGIPLIVDAAHGAHFGFAPGYPDSSVKEADIVIHSLHKTLPAPTQTALIHINGELISDNVVLQFLRIYETSSPSYVLMAGIDRCMDILKAEGKERLEKLFFEVEKAKESLSSMKHLRICPYTEPCKMLISVKKTVLTGEELSDILRRDYHIETEMSSDTYALCILSMMDTESGIERLKKALRQIDERITGISEENRIFSEENDANIKLMTQMSVFEAFNSEAEEIPFEEAEGRCSTEFICAYPPGIPIVVPGEIISGEVLEFIDRKRKHELNIQGVINGRVKVVKNG